jgi:hypothetical protein
MKTVRLLEYGVQFVYDDVPRPDIATVYALQDAAQAWKDITANLPGVHDGAQWAGNGKTQVTRQDRASCGLV